MKWSLIGLFVLGAVAALAAALLLASWRNRPAANVSQTSSGPRGEEVVLVASKPMGAMTIVDAECVESLKTPVGDSMPDLVYERVDVIGKVLAVPMVKGQAFRRDTFVPAGSGAMLAASLEKGKRAMAVSLSDYSGIEGVLYPGCSVDVLAAFEVPLSDGRKETVSTVLLSNVHVLGIESQGKSQSTVSPNKVERSGSVVSAGGKKIVTLLVDRDQAQTLQLATEHGTISLAMRNPLDDSPVSGSLTLSQLAKSYHAVREPVMTLASASPTVAPQAPSKAPPGWVTTILRAGAQETKEFAVPQEASGGKSD